MKVKSVDILGAPSECIGKIGTISDSYETDYKGEYVVRFDVPINSFNRWNFLDKELELVEEPERTFGQIIDEIINNPQVTVASLAAKLNDKDKKIEDLEVELKHKQSKIDFLEGQISVYTNLIKESEEN